MMADMMTMSTPSAPAAAPKKKAKRKAARGRRRRRRLPRRRRLQRRRRLPEEEGREEEARQEKGSEAQGGEEEGRPEEEGRQAQARQEEGSEAQGCEEEGCPEEEGRQAQTGQEKGRQEEIGFRGNPSVAAAMDPKTGDAQVSPVLFGPGDRPAAALARAANASPLATACRLAGGQAPRQSRACGSCRRAWTCLPARRGIADHAQPLPAHQLALDVGVPRFELLRTDV